jgi:hypothetical protein
LIWKRKMPLTNSKNSIYSHSIFDRLLHTVIKQFKKPLFASGNEWCSECDVVGSCFHCLWASDHKWVFFVMNFTLTLYRCLNDIFLIEIDCNWMDMHNLYLFFFFFLISSDCSIYSCQDCSLDFPYW